MTLRKLNNSAPIQEALIRIYKSGKAVLNANAARLLELTPEVLVDVRYDEEAHTARKVKRLYIGTAKTNAHAVRKRGFTYSICSSALCHDIADALEGYGTYRICPEDYATDTSGIKFYNIFFKKYD